MLHLFSSRLISDDTADWMSICSQWILQEFDQTAFIEKSQLVLPDRTHFPTQISSPVEMAQYVLHRVTELAGIAHWPWQLIDGCGFQPATPNILGLETHRRFVNVLPDKPTSPENTLYIPIVADQLKKPQDLVASITHACAQHWLWQSQKEPPGGMAHFEQAAEMLAVFWGFGLMLTNSAYTYRGSCASCYNPRANRQASLSESETVYALALFCELRNESRSLVFKYLTPHLKSDFKIAQKQIRRHPTLTMPKWKNTEISNTGQLPKGV